MSVLKEMYIRVNIMKPFKSLNIIFIFLFYTKKNHSHIYANHKFTMTHLLHIYIFFLLPVLKLSYVPI